MKASFLRSLIPAAALLLAAALAAGASAQRLTPQRPAIGPVLAVTVLDGVQYHSVSAIAQALSLKTGWQQGGENLLLSDANTRLTLEKDGRDAFVNNLRVHLGNPTVFRRNVLYLSRTDYERAILPRIRPALIPNPPGRPTVIFLDAGHGGWDPGFSNTKFERTLVEKDLNLDIVLKLGRMLEEAGYTVAYTRKDDRPLGPDKRADLRARAAAANAANASLFVSVHLNSNGANTATGGTEIYTYTPAGQRSTESWQSKVSDIDADPVPVNRFDAWSSVLAQHVQGAMVAELKTTDRGQKTMHALILSLLTCPGVLVESLFLSSDREAQRIATAAGRQSIAKGIFDGIRAYSAAVASVQPASAR